MSTVTNAVTTCPPLQENLDNLFDLCPALGLDPITLVPFLYSPENRTALPMLLSPVPGKQREILAVYDQLIMDTEVQTTSSCDGICTATTERGDLSTTYSMDCDSIYLEELFDPAAWQLSCRNNYDVINRKILSMIATLDNKASKMLVSQVGGLVGNWSSDVDGDLAGNVLQVETRLPGTLNPNPETWVDIDAALGDAGYCRPIFMAAGNIMWKYNQLMQAGCCSQWGVDLGTLFSTYGKAVTKDKHVQEAFGNDFAIAVQLGAIQILTLNLNGGTETDLEFINVGPNAGTEFAGIINSPYTGLPYDLTVSYVCRKIHIILEGRFKAVGMPLDMIPTGHRLEGITFANFIQVDNTPPS